MVRRLLNWLQKRADVRAAQRSITLRYALDVEAFKAHPSNGSS